MLLTDTRIRGDSSTAKQIRDLDWSRTPLGTIDAWSDALISTVNLVLTAPIPIQLFWGPDFICIYNDAMVPALSNKHPESLGQPAREVWSEAWDTIGPQMEHVARTGNAVSFGNALVPLLRNGVLEDRYWTYSYSPVFDAEGTIVGVLDVAQDTTDFIHAEHAERARELAEKEALEKQEQLGLVLEATSLASWFYDPVRNMVGGDALMGRLFGLSTPEGPAEVWIAAIVPEDRERVGREFAAGIQGEPYDTEYRVLVDGEVHWLRAKARTLRDSNQEARMLGICEDITERKNVEAKLHETVERLTLAQQIGNIAAWDWDLRTGAFVWDEAGAWVYGRSPAELADIDTITTYIHKDDIKQVMAELAPCLAGNGEFNTEFRVCWPDESNHWLLGKGRPVLSEKGEVVRLIGVNIDITERRTAETALRQTEKLAAVGQLASTIAHEINNPLEAVTNLLYLSKVSTREPDVVQYISTAEVELRRVAAITSQTLRFHKQQSRASEITCVDLFTNALLIFQGRIENSSIRVEKRKRAERPVACLEGEIRQVMNNLIGNAIDAMKKDGGRLLVRSAEGTDWKTGRKGLRLTVADTGTGMNKKTLGHLFQAFYTTKGISGTGLGLWVSQEIVQRHQGRLTVRSSDQPRRSGTVFNLFLPFENRLATEMQQGV